jgi:glycosyltransferase involved in cell wall biosynthesis
MKIVMLGLKGLPGIHGGVEKHVEQLGSRLAARGHDVRVYCRKAYTPEPGRYMGMNLQLSPTIHTKHLDATVHTFLAGFKAGFSDADLVHFHGIGPASMAWIARILGKPVVSTIHSQDYLRDKWNPAVKWALRRAESATLALSNRVIVVSRILKERYRKHASKVDYIPNGVSTPQTGNQEIIRDRWGLEPGRYVLWVGRISPEKGPHYLVEAFAKLDTELKLVLAGGTSHTDEYLRQVRDSAEKDSRVVMTDYVTGDSLDGLYANAAAFVLPSEHEGLPVALLEAMSYGVPCLAAGIAPCKEVGCSEGEDLISYFEPRNPNSLAANLDSILKDMVEHKQRAERAAVHVLQTYGWDSVAEAVEKQYLRALEGR